MLYLIPKLDNPTKDPMGNTHTTSQPLDSLPQGTHGTVVRVDGEDNQAMAIRLGLSEGSAIMVLSKVPGGPLVIAKGSLEIALGREICKAIAVEVLP